MIITLSGEPGSGKSSVGKILAQKMSYKHYSTGDFMRDMAKERGISLAELSAQAEKNRAIDEELDQRQKKLGHDEDNFVIDARIGYHFIPKAFNVFLKAEVETRAKRILQHGRSEESSIDLNGMIETMKNREKSEKTRYKQFYGIDFGHEEDFDLVIDTSNIPIEKVVEIIIYNIKSKTL